eukprot:TRINITY_DN16254_c0_g1_i5.p1 TRINITY_DN16254_c0_g1~~TRINITY_DN16254_c0_g1_i5.p1  ORF type:complete len:385 (-),score=93.39 TRINITY_DN16254_c0_g1_i5:56-1210(-)
MSVLCSNANAADEFLRRREDMNDQERLLYFKDITGRRPFKLELLRWSHARGDTTSQPVETRSASATSAIAIQEETDEVLERVLYGEWPLQPGEQTECLEGGDPEGVEVCTRLSSSASAADFDVVVCAAAELDQEDDEEVQERHCFQQLECLTGGHRYTLDSDRLGLLWQATELSGVFLRHSGSSKNGVMLWLPEAGPNFLLQAGSGQPWLLVEVLRLRRERVPVGGPKRWPTSRVGKDAVDSGPTYVTVSFPDVAHDKAKVRPAELHLTDQWIEATEELRAVRAWDWRPTREGSPYFEVARAKFAYNAKQPLADLGHGLCGEVRWQWRWTEDFAGGTRHLRITNSGWRVDGSPMGLRLQSDGSADFVGPGGNRLCWGQESHERH